MKLAPFGNNSTLIDLFIKREGRLLLRDWRLLFTSGMLIKGHGLKAKSKYSVLAVFRYLNYFDINVKFLKKTHNLHFCVNPPPKCVVPFTNLHFTQKTPDILLIGSDYCNSRHSRNIQFEITSSVV